MKKRNSKRCSVSRVLSFVLLIAMLCMPIQQIVYAENDLSANSQINEETIATVEAEDETGTPDEEEELTESDSENPVPSENQLLTVDDANDNMDSSENDNDNSVVPEIENLPKYEDSNSAIVISSCSLGNAVVASANNTESAASTITSSISVF